MVLLHPDGLPKPWCVVSGITAGAAALRTTRKCRTLGSSVSGVSSVIQRGTRLGDHGRFPDEDLH